MSGKHLFLFGGGAPFNESLGRKFATLSAKALNKVVILLLEQDGWLEYMPKYTDLLAQNGVAHFEYLLLMPNPSASQIEQLQSASGIIICGGDTGLYRDYIVDTEVGSIVKKLYLEGVPVAGFSAGALVCPNVCVIPPIDNSRNEHLFLKGLALLNDCIISAHFSKWDEEKNLIFAITKANLPIGYGIDDGSGIYFKDEVVSQTAGQVYFYYGKE